MGLPDEGIDPVPPKVRLVGDAASPVNGPLTPPCRGDMFGIRYPNIDRKASCSPIFFEVSSLDRAGDSRQRIATGRRKGRQNVASWVVRDRSASATTRVHRANDRFAPTR